MIEIEILEVIEPFVELINLILALVIVVYGITVAKLLKSDLQKIWIYMLGSILLFGVHEVVGTLAEFKIFEIGGLYALTELLFIVMFVITVYKFHHFFKSLKSGKK